MIFLLNHNLTLREIQVVKYVLDNYPQQLAADELCISVNTLKKHVSNLYKKLNIKSRSELMQILMNA